ncbi:MAG TPA: VTT domain-containing protein [Acidobacteriaceae bacterium]
MHPVVVLHKLNAVLMATLKPLGIWGLGGLAFIDSGFFPLPTTMNGLVLDYVDSDHRKLLAYCFMAAFASAVGSMIPYYVGRAGGEVFLLKRINRERYERMRDRFERQEFLAIMIPAMLPPPTPIKLFEFGAGVFEMKPAPFVLAIFTGKFIQFLVWSVGFVTFGPGIVHAVSHVVHEHSSIVMGVASAAGLALIVYVLRKLFDRKRGTKFPLEDAPETHGEAGEDSSITS